ncbi:MAG TPA: hypothetical protein PLS69_09140, partial [Terricaulis sp.]|nr:hypothetical protein [Terricaulis sp.]
MLTIVKHSQRLGTLFRPWIGALALALSACAPDISGAYVARGENLVLMLQVVVTPDNQLSGTLHQVSLKPDGGVETFTAALTGVVSGGDIAMTMRPNGYFTTNVNLSATHAPGVLNVTWMGRDRVSTSTLRQGRVRDFTRHAEELQQRGNAIRAEKAEQRRQAQARRAAENRRTRMTALTADLEQAAARHVESISRVTQRETSFKEATVQMSQWLSQWRNA